MKKFLFCLLILMAHRVVAQDMPVIDIVFDGSTAHVIVPDGVTDVIRQDDGSTAYVSLYSSTTAREYRYRLSGETRDGGLMIQGNYKLTLELAGVDITSQRGAAIDVECGKRIAVVLSHGSRNSLVDSEGGLHKAAMYFTGHPEFEGAGQLDVEGRTKHAIAAKEYLEIKEGTGTINVMGAVSDGIHCGKGKPANDNCYFRIKGGVINVDNVGSDCIDADDYGTMKIDGGELNLHVRAAGGAGLKCDSLLTMTDGIVSIDISGADAEGIRVNHSAYFEGGDIHITNSGAGSKGIKLKKEKTGTVLDGGFAYFLGTDVDIVLTGDNYTDPVTADISRCMGVSVDQDMSLTQGDILVTVNGGRPKAYNIKGELTVGNQGRIIITGNESETRPQDFLYDMSLYFVLEKNLEQIDDYANYQVNAVNENDTYCGTADIYVINGGRLYCFMRVYSNDPGENIYLEIFNSSDIQSFDSNETFTFVPDATLGRPSAPRLFTFGRPSIQTLTRLIQILLDGSDRYTTDDIQPMVDRILKNR